MMHIIVVTVLSIIAVIVGSMIILGWLAYLIMRDDEQWHAEWERTLRRLGDGE